MLLVFLICITIFCLIFAFFGKTSEPKKACIKEHCFNLELAQTPEERETGLMFRPSLNQDSGMLFIFPESGKYSFWMKNTLIPLDIIFIDESNSISQIETAFPCNLSCPSIQSNNQVRHVLEINANISRSYNFSIGDKVSFS